MKMPKPTEADKEAFRSLVPDGPEVEVKPMFGNLAAFVNGNMFMGLFGADIGLKLDPADRDELLAVEGAGPFGPTERPMSGYVTIPVRWRSTPDEAHPWIEKALTCVAALPPKAKKAKKAKKGKG
jgi:TfoX/Sxy family transcriptional regulator of competence genes